MNVAITDGVHLMPPPFSEGLDVWSSEDGTSGAATYDGAANAAIVPADQDFGGCLELVKNQGTQRLRWSGETPILPGVYLRITARVKAVSGALPTVRIAGWAGSDSDAHVGGLTETGPSVTLTSYGEVVEVSAIVGAGNRSGVDMAWKGAAYGHFGLDLTGPNGGVVRIDDIVIEDITVAFLPKKLGWVDVRDYGALGDGSTDDRAAFLAADDDADGREVFVPAGTFRLASDTTIDARVRFEGQVTLPANQRLVLKQNFDLPTYIDAFGGDEMEGFRRAVQALMNYNDHESLDMCGRRIEVTEPIDMQAAEGNLSTFESRRVIRNGQFNVVDGPAWNVGQVTSAASYTASNPRKLTSVANVANIEVGSRVSGSGVGREVYVTEKNVGQQSVTLSQPLWGATANQIYTFTRYRYVLDFSGFQKVSKFEIVNVELQCNSVASGILLAPDGATFRLADSTVNRPKDRGVTSHGLGCQDLQIERCHFNSSETSTAIADRGSVGFNTNANDTKIRDNQFQRFLHTAVMFGSGHLILGNHLFQGDGIVGSTRVGGLVLTLPSSKSVVSGNYVDNCFIEWTNEHDAEPEYASEYSFGSLTVTANTFTISNAQASARCIVIKPYGPDHFLQGFAFIGNTIKATSGNIDRIDAVDDSIAPLDFMRTRNVVYEGNTFNGIDQVTSNPAVLEFVQSGEASNWVLNVGGYMPFGGIVRNVQSVVLEGSLTNGSGQKVYAMPHVTPNYGDGTQVRLSWPEAVKGRVVIAARCDNPV